MKSKRSPALTLVACLLLFVEHGALAFYNPQTGSWLNRDGTEEKGGVNLYGFAFNDGVNKIDLKGQAVWWDCVICAGAIGAKFQGTVAGCAFGCAEVSSPSYPYGQCLSECLAKSF